MCSQGTWQISGSLSQDFPYFKVYVFPVQTSVLSWIIFVFLCLSFKILDSGQVQLYNPNLQLDKIKSASGMDNQIWMKSDLTGMDQRTASIIISLVTWSGKQNGSDYSSSCTCAPCKAVVQLQNQEMQHVSPVLGSGVALRLALANRMWNSVQVLAHFPSLWPLTPPRDQAWASLLENERARGLWSGILITPIIIPNDLWNTGTWSKSPMW